MRFFLHILAVSLFLLGTGEDALCQSTGVSPIPAETKPLAPAAEEISDDDQFPLKIVGVTVTPNKQVENIAWGIEGGIPETEGGKVQIFVENTAPVDSKQAKDFVNTCVLQFNGLEPKKNIFSYTWSWEDSPAEWEEHDTTIPPGTLTTFTFNALQPDWITPKKQFTLNFIDWENARENELTVTIPKREVSLSAASFLSTGVDKLRPDSLVFYLQNHSEKTWEIKNIQFYQPYQTTSYRLLRPIATIEKLSTYPQNRCLKPDEKMAVIAHTPNHLTLTTSVIKISLVNTARLYETISVWEKMNVRRESFDIGAGWISTQGINTLTAEPYLRLLKKLHITAANIQNVPGYTDQTNETGLYTRYPLRMMETLQPLYQYDTDQTLPNIFAAETLGNVQDDIQGYTPQDAMEFLRAYGASRVPTALILTNPYNWHHYTGISDYQHFNLSRLAIPNDFEEWQLYTRWEKPIAWAAPLETTGILTRHLRDINRPCPIGAWIQGPFDAWQTQGTRKRLAPTPEELRSLAWHTLAARVSSFHWFNLNIGSLIKYRDLIQPIQEINREAKLLDVFFIYGDSWQEPTPQIAIYQPESAPADEEKTEEGTENTNDDSTEISPVPEISSESTNTEKPSTPQNDKQTQTADQSTSATTPGWDLSSIISPRGALLCALDTDYEIDRKSETFKFKRPRDAQFTFTLPDFLASPTDVFRIDANGIYEVEHEIDKKTVLIRDKQTLVALYIATRDKTLREDLIRRQQGLIKTEEHQNIDPLGNRKDMDILKDIAKKAGALLLDDGSDDTTDDAQQQ